MTASATDHPRLLICESAGFSAVALQKLRTCFDVELADLDRHGLLAAIREADAAWVKLRHRIDTEVLAAAQRLRCLVTNTTGLNHLDLQEAERRGIQVLSLRGETEFLKQVRATAELTVALLLALIRKLPQACAHVAQGGWNRDLFKGHELYGRTAGIVGYGRLGRIVAHTLLALGMRVLACSPNLDPHSVEPGVEPSSLDELLPQCDAVLLHANLTPENRGFFGEPQFAAMRPRSWFVNTARGELVDELALLDALESGRLAGAALDVLCDERAVGMPDHPLVRYATSHDTLLLTPHIGGNTYESSEKTEIFLANRLVEWWPEIHHSTVGQST